MISTRPHPFQDGAWRPSSSGWYRLCAACGGTEDATFGTHAPGTNPPVHPCSREDDPSQHGAISPFTRRALAGILPAKELAW